MLLNASTPSPQQGDNNVVVVVVVCSGERYLQLSTTNSLRNKIISISETDDTSVLVRDVRVKIYGKTDQDATLLKTRMSSVHTRYSSRLVHVFS